MSPEKKKKSSDKPGKMPGKKTKPTSNAAKKPAKKEKIKSRVRKKTPKIKKVTGPKKEKVSLARRDILKGMATIPVFGPFLYALIKKKLSDDFKRKEILAELGISGKPPAVLPKPVLKKTKELVRLGIIGFGGRGEDLVHAAGFAHPDWIERKKKQAKENKLDKSLETFLLQEDLNVVL